MATPRRSDVWKHPKTARAVERELGRIGARLREARTEHGWTLEQTAERAGIHAVSLSRIENGQTNVTVATLVALSLALGLDLADVFASP